MGQSLKSADLKFCPKAHRHPIHGLHSSQVLVCRSQWTWPSQDTFITYLTSYFNVLWQLNSLSRNRRFEHRNSLVSPTASASMRLRGQLNFLHSATAQQETL